LTPRHFAWLIPAFAALAMMSLPTLSLAQAPPAPPPGGGNVALSPAQQARYNARLQQYNKDRTAVVQNTKLSDAQKKAKLLTLFKALDTDMLAMLSPAQRAQVIKLRQKNAAFQKAHGSEIAQGQALAAKLNASLTPDEKAKMAKIGTDTRTQMMQVDADTSLSAQAKAAKKKTIYNAGEAQALAVLTPAQQADLKKMQAMQKKLIAESGMPTHP
jgi:hypothetical protein